MEMTEIELRAGRIEMAILEQPGAFKARQFSFGEQFAQSQHGLDGREKEQQKKEGAFYFPSSPHRASARSACAVLM